MCRFKL